MRFLFVILCIFSINYVNAQNGLTVSTVSLTNYEVGCGSDGEWHELINTSTGEIYALMAERNISDFSGEVLPNGWVRTSNIHCQSKSTAVITVSPSEFKRIVIDSYGNAYVYYSKINGVPQIIGSH